MYLLCFLLQNQLCAQQIKFKIAADAQLENYGQVVVEGLDSIQVEWLKQKELSFADWASFFRISVTGSDRAVIGTYDFTDYRPVFTPRFLPDMKIEYVIRFLSEEVKLYIPGLSFSEDVIMTAKFDDISTAENSILKIYPESDTLPSNILRMYITFSTPMGLEDPYDFLRLEHINGHEIRESFVEIKQGLWNTNRTRLTLLFHPGRIKRGIGPHMTLGPVFKGGESYRLSVAREWKNNVGTPLGTLYSKTIHIRKAERTRISPEDWQKILPKRNTIKPLILPTDRILDHALVSRLIHVEDATGSSVAGEVCFNSGKQGVEFWPEDEWSAGRYYLMIDPGLEDISGNTILNAFDYEEGSRASKTRMYREVFVIK